MEANITKANANLAQSTYSFFNGKAFSKWARQCNVENDILDYCIKKAWIDATIYERKRVNSKIMCHYDEIKLTLKSELVDKLTYITSNFDDWHKSICLDTSYGMRCGVWQKFINMAFKYIYCVRAEKVMLTQFDSVFPQCQCPLDRRIAKYILNIIKPDEVNYDLIKSISHSGVTNWNNMDYEQYFRVQSVIDNLASKENLTALEFDIIHWDEQRCEDKKVKRL